MAGRILDDMTPAATAAASERGNVSPTVRRTMRWAFVAMASMSGTLIAAEQVHDADSTLNRVLVASEGPRETRPIPVTFKDFPRAESKAISSVELAGDAPRL